MFSKRIRTLITTVALAASAFSLHAQRQMEWLDRGLVALQEKDGNVFVTWRFLGTDPDDTAFNLYCKDSTGDRRVNAEPITGATCYIDTKADSKQDKTYYVKPLLNGKEYAAGNTFTVRAGSDARDYLPIKLDVPPPGTNPKGESYVYSANDCSVGDLDGDGQYEIIVKWDPSNSKDNSQGGFTGNVYLDAYKLNGTRLWRIDLGKNIRAGAHYTQLMVYDFDGDGRAEIACKTADGTTDAEGRVIGDPSKDWRNSRGYILSGPEYLTIFNGLTGTIIDTVDYDPPRYPDNLNPTSDQLKKMWGDGYGNRMDRFLACVAYLDGVHPSLVMCRGYYTRTVLAAWDFSGGKLNHRWTFDSDANDKNRPFRGQGNHGISVADVDNDGRDEIIYGAMVLDDDGTGLHTTGFGHGDAMHVTDLDPTIPGLEIFDIQERFDDAGAHFRNARTGEVYWKKASVKAGADGEGPGRANAFDIDPRYPGSECWVKGAGITPLFDAKGNVISEHAPRSCNFGVWWDGDLLRELLDKNYINKWNWEKSTEDRILTAPECTSNNGTKATPCLSADILGDWREEVVWRTQDSSELHIYVSTIPTQYRITTLMHDPQYRLSIAWQNVSYNQPPHTSFYLGSDTKFPLKRTPIRPVVYHP